MSNVMSVPVHSVRSGDVETPGVRAAVIALAVGGEADVGEADLRAGVRRRDVERDVGARPLRLVLDEVEVAVHHVPGDPAAGDELGDLLRAAVNVLVAVGEGGTELIGA